MEEDTHCHLVVENQALLGVDYMIVVLGYGLSLLSFTRFSKVAGAVGPVRL